MIDDLCHFPFMVLVFVGNLFSVDNFVAVVWAFILFV